MSFRTFALCVEASKAFLITELDSGLVDALCKVN